MALIRWVVFPPLILTILGFLSGQGIPQGIQSQSILYSVDADQSAAEHIHNFDLSTIFGFWRGFEIEVEEDTEDDDHHYSNRKPSQPLALPLALSKRTDGSLFPTQKLIKLYILFHSWKSFLFI